MANWWEPSQSLVSSDDAVAQAPAIRSWSPEQLAQLQAVTPQAPPSLMQAMETYRQARAPEQAPVEEPEAPVGDIRNRTWGELGSDVLTGIGRGAHGMTSGLANLADLATFGGVSALTKAGGSLASSLLGGPAEGYTLQEGSQRISQALADNESAPLQQRRKQFQQTMETTGQQGGLSGGLDKFLTGAKETLTDPVLMGQMAAEQIPMLATLGAGTVGTVGKVSSAARAAGATAEKAAELGAQAATRGNIGMSGALGAGFSSQQAAEEILNAPPEAMAANPQYAELRKTMGDREARQALALKAGYPAAAVAGPLSALAGRLTAPLETQAFLGQLPKGIAPVLAAGGREMLEEIPQESSEQIGSNLGANFAGMDRSVWEGVPEAAGMAGVAGLLMGMGLGGVNVAQQSYRERTDGRVAGESANEQADLIRASLPVLSEDELDKALGALRQTLTTPKLPDALRERLTASIGELDTEFQNRANGATLKATLTSPDQNVWLEPRSRNTLIGMARPERFGALSDEDLTNARDLSLRLAEVPSLMEQSPNEVEALAKSARAYHQEFQLRRASADLTGALQQNPDIGQALAGQILLDANGNPSAHQTPEYQRASLSDTQLERWLTSGQALLRDHADKLTEAQRTALPLALDALQQENDFRDNTPNWLERNDAIREQHDPTTQRLLAQLQGKKGATVASKLNADQLPIIDRLIGRLDGQQAPYTQMGVPVPAKVSAPLNLLQQRKATLQAEMTEQERQADLQRQAAEAKQQADYLKQRRAPIPATKAMQDATPTNADPLGDWLAERANIADEQGEMLRRTLAAMQTPQVNPAQQQRAQEAQRLQAARLTGELIQQGVIEQADQAQVQADIAEWIGNGGMPRPSGAIGQMGMQLGQAPTQPAPAANSGSLAGAMNPPKTRLPEPTIIGEQPTTATPDLILPEGTRPTPLTPRQTEIAALQTRIDEAADPLVRRALVSMQRPLIEAEQAEAAQPSGKLILPGQAPVADADKLAAIQAQIAALQAKENPLASEQARLKRLQNESDVLAGQDELPRLLGPAPAPQPVPRPVSSGPQTFDDLLQRDSTAGNVPTAPMAAQGPIAEPAPPAPRPKMTQEEIKARQGRRGHGAAQTPTPLEEPTLTTLHYTNRDGEDRKVAATTVPGLAPHLGDAPQFVVHFSTDPKKPGTWQVSHQESGAGIADGDTQESAIQAAAQQLQEVTLEAFNDLVAKFTHARNQTRYARVNREAAADAERARIEAMIEQRTAEVKDLRAKVKAWREAIRQEAKRRIDAGAEPETLKDLTEAFKQGKNVLFYLDNQAFDARDARGGNVNPRSMGAQLFPIPPFVLDYANGPVPSPTTPETPNEKGQTQTEALLKALYEQGRSAFLAKQPRKIPQEIIAQGIDAVTPWYQGWDSEANQVAKQWTLDGIEAALRYPFQAMKGIFDKTTGNYQTASLSEDQINKIRERAKQLRWRILSSGQQQNGFDVTLKPISSPEDVAAIDAALIPPSTPKPALTKKTAVSAEKAWLAIGRLKTQADRAKETGKSSSTRKKVMESDMATLRLHADKLGLVIRDTGTRFDEEKYRDIATEIEAQLPAWGDVQAALNPPVTAAPTPTPTPEAPPVAKPIKVTTEAELRAALWNAETKQLGQAELPNGYVIALRNGGEQGFILQSGRGNAKGETRGPGTSPWSVEQAIDRAVLEANLPKAADPAEKPTPPALSPADRWAATGPLDRKALLMTVGKKLDEANHLLKRQWKTISVSDRAAIQKEWEKPTAPAPAETTVTTTAQLNDALANEGIAVLPDGSRLQIRQQKAMGARPTDNITEFVLSRTMPSGTVVTSQGSVLNPQSLTDALNEARKILEGMQKPAESAKPVPMPMAGWWETPVGVWAYANNLIDAGYLDRQVAKAVWDNKPRLVAMIQSAENTVFRKQQPEIGTPALLDMLARRVVENVIPIGQMNVILQPFEDAVYGPIVAALRKAGADDAMLKRLGYESDAAATTDVADWWSKGLTPQGRREALVSAKLNPDRHLVLWKNLKDDEQRKLAQVRAKGVAETDPNIGRQWESVRGQNEVIARVIVDGKPRYQVRVGENTGSAITELIEAEELDGWIASEGRRLKSRRAYEAKAADDEAQAAETKRNYLRGYDEAFPLSNFERANLVRALEQPVKRNGSIITRKALIESIVDEGGASVGIREGQDALISGNGTHVLQDVVTQTGMSYARWLIDQKAKTQTNAATAKPAIGAGVTSITLPVGAAAPAATPAPAPTQAADWGANNTLVSRDRADELRKKLRAKLGQANMGLDPEIVAMGTELAVFHIEAGVRKFADFARVMVSDLGVPLETIRPFLRGWYNGARDMVEDHGLAVDDMDAPEQVKIALKALSAPTQDTNNADTTQRGTAGSGPGTVRPPDSATGTGDSGQRGGRPAGLDGDRGNAGELEGQPPGNVGAAGTPGNQSGTGYRPSEPVLAGAGSVPPGGDAVAGRPSGSNEGVAAAGAGGRGGRGGNGGQLGGTGAGTPGVTGTAGTPGGRTGGSTGSETGIRSDGGINTDAPITSYSNYHITDPAALVGGTPKVRFARNRAAIETYRALTTDARQPTEAELTAIASYIGWGSFGQELFQGTWERPKPNKGWEKEDAWLRNHLGQDEWESAQRSIINAHYTDPPTVQALWAIAEQLGFKGGRVLEPSMGIGNFFGLMPREMMARSALTGIEMDTLTGGMAKLLYPDANIQTMPYQDSQTADGFYDLAIGNWPFFEKGPADRRYNALAPSLHDYFFLKTLDQVRAGGLVIGITSAGTMDKVGRGARLAMAKKADLVAAFRLPSGAFEEYAGTKVVTDILIFQKRAEGDTNLSAQTAGWIELAERPTPSGTPVKVNEYWTAHPENILGTLNFGHGTTTFREGMIVDRPKDLAQRLVRLPSRLPNGIYQPHTAQETVRYLTNYTTDRQQSIVIGPNGGLYVVQGERLADLNDVKKWQVKDAQQTAMRQAQLEALVQLRQLYGALIPQERDGDPATETTRTALKAAYTAFVAEHGPLNESWGLGFMGNRSDPHFASLASLERNTGTKEAPVWTPSRILSQATMRGKVLPENPSIRDALVIVRNESPVVNLARVAELAKVTEEQAAAELVASGTLYPLPTGGYEVADIYLSGNVRRKLREARAAQEEGVDLSGNIQALEARVPKTVPYFNIEARMGAQWMPTSIYQQFVAELLNEPLANVNITNTAGNWRVDWASAINSKPEATTIWGTGSYPFNKLVRHALNNQPIVIKYKDEDGNMVVDDEATKTANSKMSRLREEFSLWIWKDPARQVELEAQYNEVMNAIALPAFDGSFLSFDGLALQRGDSEFNLRQHQIDAIWMGLANGRGLYAHEVGTGKSYTIAGIAAESRRYGLAKKPLILAHNANSKAMAASINEMYPGAKVLYIDNLTPQTIDIKLRQIASDDWDAVVMPHSLLDRLALSRKTMEALAADEISALEEQAIEAAADDGFTIDENTMDDPDAMKKVRSPTAKQLVKAREQIINTINKQAQRASREGAVLFEDLGIDMIMVDESHEFGKPPLSTKMRMRGLNTGTSNRSIALQFLTGYVKGMNDGRGVHLFTGTPITNTLTETYHAMRYLMDDQMARDGLKSWDAWFNTFASDTDDIELTPAGEYEPVTRLAAFINVAELRRMMGQFVDIVFADDMPEFQPRQTASGKTLNDPTLTDEERDELLNGRTDNAIGRPYKKIVTDVANMSPQQEQILMTLAELARDFKNASKKDRREMQLNGHPASPIINEGLASKASLDQRLYDLDGTITDDHANSKAQRVIRNTLKHYQEHPLANQVIFVDTGYSDETMVTERGADGTPIRDADGQSRKVRKARFNLVQAIVGDLVAQGIPRQEIAIVDGNVKAEQRQAIADAMNSGKIRVVIGMTNTLGIGVNMQNNLRAIHHIDAPWRPGDLEQRNGRGHRQGNQWNTVLEYRYLTERLDGRRWQVLMVKQRFISAFLKADENLRVIEGDAVADDESNDLAATLSDAAGDPRILQVNQINGQVKKLQDRERMHGQAIYAAQRKRNEITGNISWLDSVIAELQEDVDVATAARDAGFTATIAGKTYTDRKEAQAAVDVIIKEGQVGRRTTLGEVNGFALSVYWPALQSELQFQLSRGGRNYAMGGSTIASAEATLRQLPALLAKRVAQRDSAQVSLEQLEATIAMPFGRAAELERKQKLLLELEADLQANPVPAPAWLRHGAPIGTAAFVDGQEGTVEGHQWTVQDYRVQLSFADGTNRSVPYDQVTDAQGLAIYEAKPFAPPPSVANLKEQATKALGFLESLSIQPDQSVFSELPGALPLMKFVLQFRSDTPNKEAFFSQIVARLGQDAGNWNALHGWIDALWTASGIEVQDRARTVTAKSELDTLPETVSEDALTDAPALVAVAADLRSDAPDEITFIQRLVSRLGETARRWGQVLWNYTGKALALALAINIATPSNFSIVEQAQAKQITQTSLSAQPTPMIQAVQVALAPATFDVSATLLNQAMQPVTVANQLAPTPVASERTALERFKATIEAAKGMKGPVQGSEKDTDTQWQQRADAARAKAARGEALSPLEVAFTLYGEQEGDSAQIQQVLDYFGSKLNQDQYAWCAPFMSFVHARAGVPLKTQSARAFLRHGEIVELTDAREGDVLVLRNTNTKTGGWTGWGGHVVLIVKRDGDVFYGLGGNQNDEVNVTLFHKDRVLGVRRIEAPIRSQQVAQAGTGAGTQRFAIANTQQTGFFDDDNTLAPIVESEEENQKRMKVGYTQVIRVNAAKLQAEFEKQNKEKLVHKPLRVEKLRGYSTWDAHPHVGITPYIDRLSIADGRHRVAVAAERGQDIEVAVPADRVEALQDMLGSAEPATVNQDAAYLDAVKRGDMETAQRMVNEAAEKAGVPIINEQDVTAYKVRRTAPPKKTIKAYKLFRVKKNSQGEVFALFVGANDPLPQDVWLDAIAGPGAGTNKSGGPMVKSKLGPLSFRPGWHAGDIPLATHIGAKQSKSSPIMGRKEDEVWAEVDVAADVDYQPQANANGTRPDGRFVVGDADIKSMPEDGMYRYKTNPNMTGQWIISGSMKINRILSENEVNQLLRDAGYTPMPWTINTGEKVNPYQEAPLDLARFGLSANPAVNQKKLLDPVTYDDAGNIIPLSQRFNKAKQDVRFATSTTSADVRSALESLAGNALVQDLIDGGSVRLVAKQSQLPTTIVVPPGQRVAGAVDPVTGEVYLIAENISEADIDDFLIHEVGTHQERLGIDGPRTRSMRLARGLAKLLGAKALLGENTFNDALAQMERMRRAGNVRVKAAFAEAERAMRALDQDLSNQELVAEEALAYLVGRKENRNIPLVQRIIAAVRAFLFRAGFKVDLTEDALVSLAQSALRSAARRPGPRSPLGPVTKGVMGRNEADTEAERQMADVRAQYEGTDQWMKAPNGQPTKLNERQWLQVRTAAFKEWFGDWENDPANASKVMDENGEPLVVYHGTQGDFDKFTTTREKKGNQIPFGSHFTGSQDIADYFTNDKHAQSGDGGHNGGNIIPVFLSIKNPFVLTGNEYPIKGTVEAEIYEELSRKNKQDPVYYDSYIYTGKPVGDKNERAALAGEIDVTRGNVAKKIFSSRGYDGIFYNAGYSSNPAYAMMRHLDVQDPSFVVFSPTQIKSAIGNTGAFSPANPDIRYARALGESNPTLTADEVLAMIDAGQEVTADEFALLQAYLSGATSTLTARGIDAPSFKAWFGASKIKGRTGKPVKMYHATRAQFTVFDANRSGTSTTHATAVMGFFFTNNRGHAEARYGDSVMEVYLTLERPYQMTDADLRRIDGPEEAKAFRARLEEMGYDGIVMPRETGKTQYVAAFYPDQIKLTDNETYTRGEGDVRFARAIGPTQQSNDAEYLDAVERGDTGAAQRMVKEAAKEAGYTIGPVYHGSADGKWTVFRKKTTQSIFGKEGYFFSFMREIAEQHARKAMEEKGKRGDGRIITAYLKNPEAIGPNRLTNGVVEYVVSGATQIKSADPVVFDNAGNVIPLSQRFNPRKQDMRFAIANPQPAPGTPSQVVPPPMTVIETMRRAIQDRFLRFKTVQNWLKQMGINITPDADVYATEERSVKRFAAKAEDFRHQVLRPLVQEAAKAKYAVTGGELIGALLDGQPLPTTFKPSIPEYLIAQHAAERNAAIAKINPAYPDGGSGLTDAQAADILARYRALPDFAAFQNLAGRFRTISNGTKQMLLDEGILSADMVQAWDKAYQHYIPLKGGPEEGVQQGTGPGLSVNGRQQRAMGHGLRDENVLENIFRDRERALLLVEKNQVGKALIKMIQQANNPEIGTVGQPEKRGAVMQGWMHEVWINGHPLGAFQSYNDARAAIAADSALTGRNVSQYGVRHKASDPGVVYLTPPQLADNEATVYLDGQRVRVQLNDADLARAYNATDVDKAGGILKVGLGFNRWLSKAYTGYNPEFMLVNMARDLTAGLINLTGQHGGKLAGNALRHYLPALAETWRFARDKGNHAWVDRYRAAGGSTGAAYLSDLERIGEDVGREFQDAQGAVATWQSGQKLGAARVASMDLLHLVGGWIENFNKAGENAMRVATFRAMVEAGSTDEAAANAAANVTVNFNRRGEMGHQLSALYLFFNPNVQGTQVLLNTLLKSPHKAQAWAAAGAMVGLAYALAALARGGDDDDEEAWRRIPSTIKDRNLILKVGEHQLTIPVPFGYGAFWALGNVMSDMAHGEPADKAGMRLASALFEHFSPVGNPLVGDQMDIKNVVDLMPTLPRIMGLDVAVNRGAFGQPMMPEVQSWNPGQPDSQRQWRNTSGTLYGEFASGLNALTGGSPYESGYIDISPETIRYLIRGLLGGAGQFAADTIGLPITMTQGATPELREVPGLRKFVREETIQNARSQFYRQADQVKEAVGAFNAAKRARDADGMMDIVHDKAELIRLGGVLDSFSRLIRVRRQMQDDVKASDMPLKQRRLYLKTMEDEEARIYTQFSRIFENHAGR